MMIITIIIAIIIIIIIIIITITSMSQPVSHFQIQLNCKYTEQCHVNNYLYSLNFSSYFPMSPVSNLITCLFTSNKHIRRLQQQVVVSLHNHVQYTIQRLTLIRAKPMVVYRSGREADLSLLAVHTKRTTALYFPTLRIPVSLPN